MTVKFSNHVALPDKAKETLVETLNIALATTNDLHSQVKQAHWNIKGPQFFARHELFDTMAGRLRDFADTIAERATTMGGYATGTSRLSAEHSKLPEYDLRAVDGKQHIKVLVDRFSEYTKFIRSAIDEAGNNNDPATEDLYTEILRGTELDMWFLESHLNV
jgi:starvation-inducible DNA-binding protein